MFTTSHAPIVRTHPLTGRPLAPVGYRRNGCPIWPIMGGSEAAGEGGDAAGTDAGAAAGTDAGADTGKADAAADKGKTDANPWADPDKAKAEIERLRNENAASRTNAKTKAADDARKAVVEDIAKALGLKDGEKAPTVDELTKQLTDQTTQTEQARATARDTQAELVVWRHADDLKVDAQALTDSRAFASAIASLDPSSDTFEADVKKAAQAAAEKNPKLAAAPVAGSSSADHGGPVGGAAKKPQSLDAAVGGHYGT